MSYKEFYNWDEERGWARYEIEDKGHVFIGHAKCHPDDITYKNERIGIEIAEVRARLEALRWIRDNEVIPAYKAFKHLHSTMITSKQYNKHSYEARMLWRQIKLYEGSLASIKDVIKSYNNYIKDLANSAQNWYELKQKYENGQK